jgi:hypothetical protein
VLVVCSGSKKLSLLQKFKVNFALNIARNLPVGLQFTHGTRILLRPDVLFSMPSHPVAHVFVTLQCNSLEGASFELEESQHDVRLEKPVVQITITNQP